MKKNTHSQNLWLQRKKKDNYFIAAKKEGYRSRAAYKLLEINKKYNLIKKNINVIDLGASPGGWSQVLSHILSNSKSKIYAVDQNNIEPIENVKFIKKKIEDLDDQFLKNGNLHNISLIVSDLAPNSTGHKFTDQARSEILCYKVLAFSKKCLLKNGNLVCKFLRGEGERKFIEEAKKNFSKVEFFKPQSSRNISKEIYVICISFNNLQ